MHKESQMKTMEAIFPISQTHLATELATSRHATSHEHLKSLDEVGHTKKGRPKRTHLGQSSVLGDLI